MQNISGSKGERLNRRLATMEVRLNKIKEELIDFAIDQFDEYNPEWLAESAKQLWYEEFSMVSVAEILVVVAGWDKEIRQGIKESLEPTALEEAKQEIRKECIRGLA